LARETASEAKTFDALNGLMKLVMKSDLERMLETEMEADLGHTTLPGSATNDVVQTVASLPSEAIAEPRAKHRRNSCSLKTMHGDLGEFTLSTPRDRNSTFQR
jgi:putative transposase